jgi:hypothetical protein
MWVAFDLNMLRGRTIDAKGETWSATGSGGILGRSTLKAYYSAKYRSSPGPLSALYHQLLLS